MINLDFSIAIALLLFIFVNAIIFRWLFSRRSKDKDLSLKPQHIWHCSICAYSYINTKDEAISSCPRCNSYNEKKD